ncbi:hypothetical protein SLS56_006873 [Neofusicoccum ribis]|uniref:Major facilitator superfamily (MFS) profile domain-containing protein n=1 Tax=Neofusicoccum ribis TaxID=45134 RepID=A0ABR3SPH1_9PEZI
MDAQLEHEIEAVAGASQIDLLLETFVPVENRRRFFLIFMTTLFSQWSGANAITQYSPTIFGYLGVTGTESQFLATGIYGVVKFASCLAFALLVVDFLGRRRSLMTGIVLQILTLAYVGAYLGITGGMSTAAVEDSRAASHAGTAAIVAIYIHAVAWSIGWFSMPYLVGAEIFPTRIRSLNMSLSMAFHWAFCFGSSRSMPSLLAATHKWGAFVFFGCICLISLVYVFVAMPVSIPNTFPTDSHLPAEYVSLIFDSLQDTTGRSLESLDGLFQRPWYTVFKVAYPSPGEMRIEGRNTKVLEDPPKGGLENTKIGEAERIEDISRG